MCKFKKLFLLSVIVTGINLFISCSVMAKYSISLHSYGLIGSYKLINTRIDTGYIDNLVAEFNDLNDNFFNPNISINDQDTNMRYTFEIAGDPAIATATLSFSGILFPGNSKKSIFVSCKSGVRISNQVLTLNNSVCNVGNSNSGLNGKFMMTFNGKPSDVINISKTHYFPQLDISYTS